MSAPGSTNAAQSAPQPTNAPQFLEKSLYLRTDTELSGYSIADTRRYLDRLSIPELTDLTPSYELLSQLILAHQLAIPYDTTSVHLKRQDWLGDPTKKIEIGTAAGDGMELGKGNFERIVGRNTGGFCYALNTLFAGLLRTLGFDVGESGARVYLHRGKDPEVVGYSWSSITHEVLLVGWKGQKERYLVDAGFGGGGNAIPMLLVDGATTPSISPIESFKLTEEVLPGIPAAVCPDPAPGFILHRRITSADDPAIGHWSPLYHFSLNTICPTDIAKDNYYNEKHPQAPFVNFFVCSILLPSGARKTLAYGSPPVDKGEPLKAAEKIQAKLYTKQGVFGRETDVKFVDFQVGPIREVLEQEFGFGFV